MARYFSEQTLLDMRDKDMNYVYDLTDLEQYLAGIPAADVVPKSEVEATVEKFMSATDKVICETKAEVAREVINEIDDRLYDMARAYRESEHLGYYAVCEMVHHKVIRAVEKKYTEGQNNQ